MLKSSERVYAFLEKVLPTRLIQILDGYSVISFSMAGNREWRDQVRAYLLKILLNAVVVIAIFLLVARVFLPFLLEKQIAEGPAKFFALSLTLILTAPFLWALAFGRTKNFSLLLVEQGKGSHNYVFLISRVMLTVGLLGAMVAQFVPLIWALGITIWMIVVVGYVLFANLKKIYQWFESRFLFNLNEEVEKKQIHKHHRNLAPWDAHITEFIVPADGDYVGRPLIDLNIREKFGVTIALIERGKKRITAPGRSESLMPFDQVHVIGTDPQLNAFKMFLLPDVQPEIAADLPADYSLEQYLVSEKSPFVTKTIRECGIREATHGLVVGIERNGQRILNPDSTEVIGFGDLLWIVGDRDKILKLS
jgi:CPA2 family monovalent cation:H+ antiporter-2